MGFYTNENTYDRARGQKVIGEIQYIKSKYNLNQQALTSLAKYAQNSPVFKENNLVKLGFSEIPSGGSFFIFINDSTLKFDDTIPVDKIGFTNKLMF